VIYIEHHNGPEQTEVGRIDWLPGWYASCDDCGWSAGPCQTEADANEQADQHDLAMGEVTPDQLATQDRVIPGQELYVTWQLRHGQRPDGWWFALDVSGQPLEEHGPFDSEAAMLAAKLTRIRELEQQSASERPAAPGERCTCGRQAVVVYLGGVFGPTGYCGIADGGDRAGPCPFCGGPRHQQPEGRCPHYRLRPDRP
jgi:hypothetical protein